MDDRELERLASDLESDRVERKEAFRDKNRIPFDIRPVRSASLSDLDLDLFRRVYLPAALPDPIRDREEIDGPLPDLIRRTEEKLKSHLSVRVSLASTPERRAPDYPLQALRQLVINAVLHRNYEGTNAPVRLYWFNDRVEILSPGGPYGQVNRSNFGTPGLTDHRNPHLAEAMKNLGYVQKFGAGIPIARAELKRNGNPELEFQVEDTYVLATVRRAP